MVLMLEKTFIFKMPRDNSLSFESNYGLSKGFLIIHNNLVESQPKQGTFLQHISLELLIILYSNQ